MTDQKGVEPKERKMQGLDIGISQDELREQVLARTSERLVEHFVEEGDAERAMEAVVRETIDTVAERVAKESIEPLVRGQIESVCLQRTNEWGEPKGESMTFVEYLVKRAEAFLVERVDHKGETKAQSRSSSWNHRDTQTRITYMIDKHLQYSIKTAMEGALKRADSAIAEGIAEAVRIKLAEVSAKLKVEVKT